MLVDLDDTVIEVHGYANQGAGFGCTKVRSDSAYYGTPWSTRRWAPVPQCR